MDLENLVKQTKNNPYVSWPNYEFDSFIKKEIDTIFKNYKQEKYFEFYLDSRLVCYFQLKNLEWDSEHFGYKCAHLKHLHIDYTIFKKIESDILSTIYNDLHKFLKKENYRFIYCDIDTSPEKNILIQKLGFNYIANWIDGFVPVNNHIKNINTYDVSLNDNEIETIAEIARNNYFRGGRFYSDKRFDVNSINEMYYSLVKNAYSNGEIVLTIKHKGNPIGAFISKQVINYSEFNNLRVAHLRFLVIDNKYRGMNYSKKLFSAILDHLSEKCDIVVTGLETCNIISLNLHNKFRFKYNYSHNAYHLWI